jgi:S1-C subfamily serine protease
MRTSLIKGVKLALVAVALFGGYILVSGLYGNTTSENRALTNTSVKIVRSDKRSGGSGVILRSTPSKSYILTNSHVCGVIENGGLVIREGEEHAVVTYRRSDRSDLCLITVAADFGVNTKLAAKEPALDSPSIVVGHPKLLPTVITRGHFSDHAIIDVMTGVRPCVQADIDADQDNALLCMFLGGIPQVTRYESQLVTSMISPGSSGSPVFNSEGEISGLVFAGSGDISYGYIMPFGAVANFVNDEAANMDEFLANNTYEVTAQAMKGQRVYSPEFTEGLTKLCADPRAANSESIRGICRMHGRNLLWDN